MRSYITWNGGVQVLLLFFAFRVLTATLGTAFFDVHGLVLLAGIRGRGLAGLGSRGFGLLGLLLLLHGLRGALGLGADLEGLLLAAVFNLKFEPGSGTILLFCLTKVSQNKRTWK